MTLQKLPLANLEQQYTALHEAAGLVDLNDEEIYALEGEDRKNFLNSYNSQDIKSLSDYRSALGTFLTQKGKLVSDTCMVLVPEKILLFFPKGYGEKVSHHLATFLMFANVTLKNESKNWGHLAILGPKALQILAELFQAEIKISENQVVALQWENHPVYLWPSQRLGISGYELLGQAENMLHLNQSLLVQGKKHSASVAIPAKEAGLQKISETVLEVIRVEAGLPKMGVDMSQDNLVAEVGLDERATSFNKGCYLGQETTARVHSQGHVNKKLTQFKMEGIQNLPLPLEIFHGEKSVGQLTSVVHSPKWKQALGLGIVHRQAFEGEGELFVKGTEGPSPLAPLSEGEGTH